MTFHTDNHTNFFALRLPPKFLLTKENGALWLLENGALLDAPSSHSQGASDGRRARRLAESRPAPVRASLLVRRNSWSQLVATSRQAASRDEHPRGLRPARRLRCCGGTAEQVRPAVAGPWLGHRPTRANAIAGFDSLNKTFAVEGRTDACS